MFGSFILQVYNLWICGCLIATLSATASTKLPRGKRENKHKENIPVVQSCHAGLLTGSILMLVQKVKPKSSMIKLALLPAEMGPALERATIPQGNALPNCGTRNNFRLLSFPTSLRRG